MGAILHYIIKQFDLFIERHKHDLLEKKPGLVVNTTNSEEPHPRIIWVRMLKRPKLDGSDETTPDPFAIRGKFNLILEERIQDGNSSHCIMSIEVKQDESDRRGNLTAFGKAEFWSEVDKAIKKLDTGSIK